MRIRSKEIKRSLLLGGVFPAAGAVLICLFGGWRENFAIYRMQKCFLPIPYFLTVFFSALFFLSLGFFACGCARGSIIAENCCNAKISCLCAAFFTVIWFFLTFFAFSPLAAMTVLLASVAFAASGLLFSLRENTYVVFTSGIAALLLVIIFFMNVKVMFV